MERFASQVPDELLPLSGKVFYSGRAAFEARRDVYVLGYNPGGDPLNSAEDTVEVSLNQALRRRENEYSCYLDESWLGRPPGSMLLQRSVVALLQAIGVDPRRTPCSNLILIRSRTAATLEIPENKAVELCWPFHQAVIESLSIRAVICLGSKVGDMVAKRLGGGREVSAFTETNNRGWRSCLLECRGGLRVAALTHPSRAHWSNPDADPGPWLAGALA